MKKTTGTVLAALTLCGGFLGGTALPAGAKMMEYERGGGEAGGSGGGSTITVTPTEAGSDASDAVATILAPQLQIGPSICINPITFWCQ